MSQKKQSCCLAAPCSRWRLNPTFTSTLSPTARTVRGEGIVFFQTGHRCLNVNVRRPVACVISDPRGAQRSSTVATENEPGHPESLVSVYGKPASSHEAAAVCPRGEGGFLWQALLVRSHWRSDTDCDADGNIKPRRPTLPVNYKDFFSSVVWTPDHRWLFSGTLSGWPGLTTLELRRITYKVKSSLTGLTSTHTVWDADIDGATRKPRFPRGPAAVHATLRSPAFTLGGPGTIEGWSSFSPGCAWWYFSQQAEHRRFVNGEDMIRTVKEAGRGSAVAVRAHYIVHRYARGSKPETAKQSMLYHGCILIEWDHGQHGTIVELATRNGVGGRYGRSNWCDDKYEDLPDLYRNMPSEMILPWQGTYAEVRALDVAAKNSDEIEAYMQKYLGHNQRFVDPHVVQSEPVRLAHATQIDIMRYFLNYIGRENRYSEEWRNCQTFAADFLGFVSGKMVVPWHFVNRLTFKPRHHWFLYKPGTFEKGE